MAEVIELPSTKERRNFGTREIHDYPPVLQACHVQELLGYSERKAYEVLRSKGCPLVRDGKRMTVPRDLFWEWYLSRARESTNGGN